MKKALLVDDNIKDLADIIKELEEDFELVFAESGEAGWEMVQKHADIDIFILDYWLGGMNGLDLTEKIRGISGFEKHPILIYSTESDEKVRVRARDLNAFWLGKPINPKPFRSAVQKMTARKKS